MIYWSEDNQGWMFDKITDVEKEKIIDLGIKSIMPAIAGTVVSRLMQEARAKEDDMVYPAAHDEPILN